DLGEFRPDLCVGVYTEEHFEWRHVIFCSAHVRLFIEDAPNDDLSWSIKSIREFEAWREALWGPGELQLQPQSLDVLLPKGKTVSPRDNHECIILAGCREQLLGEDVEGIALLSCEGIQIRSYDWLLDAWDKIRP